jgi:hypothetical protein
MVQQNPNNQHWVFRDDYLECINSRAITQNIRKQLHRSIIIHVIDLNVNIIIAKEDYSFSIYMYLQTSIFDKQIFRSHFH